VDLHIYLYPLSLLGNDSVNMFPQKRIVGGVVSYAVRVVLKESRRSLVTRISCYSSEYLLRRQDDKLFLHFCQARGH
jgi:hypothetical protein